MAKFSARYVSKIMGTKITILIDNTPDAAGTLQCEKGLSLYIENGQQRILCDTGLSGAFSDNAAALGIDISAVGCCFISHAHADHSGGLKRFVDINRDSDIYIAAEALHTRYFSHRHMSARDLSIDFDVANSNTDRFRALHYSTWLSENVAAVFCNDDTYARPLGNKYLTKMNGSTELPDVFAHEMSLAITVGDELVVVSSCSHCGAANIIEACKAFSGKSKLRAFVGGLHFIDSNETSSEVEKLVTYVEEQARQAKFFVGHCTGDLAKAILSRHEQFCTFATGDIISI